MIGLGLGLGGRRAGGGGASAPVYVWLGVTLAAAPALSGVPGGSTYLNASETTNVTRGGITLRSINSGAGIGDTSGFASTPLWQLTSATTGVRFQLPAGTWQFAFILSQTFGSNSGTIEIVDDPDGAATVRQSILRSPSGALLQDTDGTDYTSAGTAIADCIANLTYVPVIVSNLGGGNGVVTLRLAAAGTLNITAIALRAP